MRSIAHRYLEISNEVKLLILSELFLHIINAAFFLILLIYMDKMGYPDHEAAGFISYRFLGVIAFALPLGLYIKGRKLRPLILASGIAVPVFSILIVYAIQFHHNSLLHASLFFWGVAFNLITVSSLPFILRNVNQETLSEAISLSYATGSLGTIIAGAIIFALSNFAPAVFDEKLILYLISFGGFIAFFFALKISKTENIPAITSRRTDLTDFDWLLIIKALIPTLIIATGAGLTIPFISLFFYKIHGLDYNRFSVIGSLSGIFVFIGAVAVPHVKRRWGYNYAITLSQSLAVLSLILLASTEWYNEWVFAMPLAVLFYVMRTPLMNMAAPMTSELVMNYVGQRNREIVSAMTTAIWSGSWFISSRIFKTLREMDFSYSNVFLITATLYALGVIWYHFLIQDYKKMRDKTESI